MTSYCVGSALTSPLRGAYFCDKDRIPGLKPWPIDDKELGRTSVRSYHHPPPTRPFLRLPGRRGEREKREIPNRVSRNEFGTGGMTSLQREVLKRVRDDEEVGYG